MEVEQYLDFAREIADHFVVMDRGEVVLAGPKDDLRGDDMRCYLTV